MKLALLGFGNIGSVVYDVIHNKRGSFFNNDIEFKHILVKNKEEVKVEDRAFRDLLTTSFDTIINDNEIDVVIEVMGAPISYNCIKKSLQNKKHVITANKEVMAEHFTELLNIAKENNVKLLFEASVGGGIPIIQALLNASTTNNINRIEGILNGTTNFILTSMHNEKISFEAALKIAQEKGFAEADPTSDLEGLDMVRKITILSQIAYQGEVDLKQVYSYGIKNISKEIVDVANLLGYKIKFIASSSLTNNEVSITVEPVMVKETDILANVDYEYNVVRYYGDNCGVQTMVGKGAGPVTVNAIVNDLYLLLKNYEVESNSFKSLEIVGNKNAYAKYLLYLNEKIDKKLIHKDLDEFVITNDISVVELNELKKVSKFYAKLI